MKQKYLTFYSLRNDELNISQGNSESDGKKRHFAKLIGFTAFAVTVIAALGIGYLIGRPDEPPVSVTTTVTTTAKATTAASQTQTTSSDNDGIVIVPDPSVISDSSRTNSSSVLESAPVTDSIKDVSTDTSSKDPEAPAFEPAGAYYSWGEAEKLMSDYAKENGIEGFAYSGGTDGIEMIYEVQLDDGSVSYYRVDLQTGYVSAYKS